MTSDDPQKIADGKLSERLREALAQVPVQGIVSAYLFGSHAAGRSHRESDIDVAVLLDWQRHPTRQERFAARLRLIGELAHALRTREDRLDIVILNDLPPLFGRSIVWDGVRFFCADPEADRAHTVQVQLRAADLAPWLERMRKLKLEALAR
ncbi:MAG TPA: nucleotidyltransferase domain-containing protein [Thermoanaerobaculia bacterium]|nr:nucleotidyltransferase domain-containing protein [Thermoanaerobaculia bacterium]